MIEQSLNDFWRYLKYEKRFSQHTLAAYQQDLTQFSSFIKGSFDVIDAVHVQHFHVRSWLASLKDNEQSVRTINRKLSAVNSFFKYLLKHQVISKNPLKQLHSIKQGERLPSYLKENESERLLEEVAFGEGFKAMTNRLICELLYKTGMRRNELLELKEQDVEWGLGQLRVLGKGNKERLIPVSSNLLKDLELYIAEKRKLFERPSAHLLVLESGQPLYANYIYRIVRGALSNNGITTLKKKSPHILRHTFATHLLNNGANIQAIKDLLGHSSLAATQVYTHNNIEKLKEIHKLNHPRG